MNTSETIYFIVNNNGELYNLRSGGSGIKIDQLETTDLLKYGRKDVDEVKKKMRWLNHWAEKSESQESRSRMSAGLESDITKSAIENDWKIVEATIDMNINLENEIEVEAYEK